MFIVVLAVIALVLGGRHRFPVPLELRALCLFAAVALGASTVVSAYGRMLLPLVPFLGLISLVMVDAARPSDSRRGAGSSPWSALAPPSTRT
jgi:hypothetical protein